MSGLNDIPCHAVVPAAGRSTRFLHAAHADMPKQLHRIGTRGMLACVVDHLAASTVNTICVITNPVIHQAIVTERPPTKRWHFVCNVDPKAEMLDSIQVGIRTICMTQWSNHVPPDGERVGFLVVPGDHPCVSTDVLDACIRAFRADPARLIIAVHAGQRGHPIIVPGDLAAEVQTWPSSRRLNELRGLHEDRVAFVETGDDGILVDVDTPLALRDVESRSP